MDLDIQALRAHWDENGFAVLPKFYSDDLVTAAQNAERAAWTDRKSPVVVDDLSINRRSRIVDVDAEPRASHRFKVNDLYLVADPIRRR